VVATNEAKTHLSALLQEVVEGNVNGISRGRKPLAKLVPWTGPAVRPRVGETMDESASVPDEALRAMTKSELKKWGLL